MDPSLQVHILNLIKCKHSNILCVRNLRKKKGEKERKKISSSLRNPINDKQFLFVVRKWNKAFCKDLHVY